MTTVHFVYPHRPRISAPSAIGRHVGQELAARGFEVVHYDIDEARKIRPGSDDVLLGHPHEAPWSVFRRSAAAKGWRRRLLLMPYVHVDTYHLSLAESVIRNCDLFLAITGTTWFETIASSVTAHWRPKMVQVDLAVDRRDFPRVKAAFNPPGARRFLYIGHTGWYKNTGYLSELAARLPEFEFAWIGNGDTLPGLTAYGSRDFATDAARALVAEHDFLLTVGVGDANPTTVLEAMAWGLLPVCTPESGYAGRRGITNVPANDADQAIAVLRDLQARTGEDLSALRAANDDQLDRHFNWSRFTDQVVGAIESNESRDCLPLPRRTRLRVRRLALARQATVFRPDRLRPTARTLLESSAAGRMLLRRWRRAGAPDGTT